MNDKNKNYIDCTLEICPLCKKEKSLSQLFVDGTDGGLCSFACKDCQRKELSKKYGENAASSIEAALSALEKEDDN